MYVTYLDGKKFLKFALEELNLDDIVKYSKFTESADKIKTFISENLKDINLEDKKLVFESTNKGEDLLDESQIKDLD
jgi:hypothetical protein